MCVRCEVCGPTPHVPQHIARSTLYKVLCKADTTHHPRHTGWCVVVCVYVVFQSSSVPRKLDFLGHWTGPQEAPHRGPI